MLNPGFNWFAFDATVPPVGHPGVQVNTFERVGIDAIGIEPIGTEAIGIDAIGIEPIGEYWMFTRATVIEPGYVATPLTEPVAIPPEAMLDADDVAHAVRFLLRLSPQASVTELVLGRAGAGALAP